MICGEVDLSLPFTFHSITVLNAHFHTSQLSSWADGQTDESTDRGRVSSDDNDFIHSRRKRIQREHMFINFDYPRSE